ncbi:ATPase, T2SS/T4P/T4SS family [Enhydrobacter sp.]|jgi:pilus assembly protein CpaF|uniref:ATPase, T2SS/T4P/T4SS family n=1 Tax=Enhydrobacter sp. TaxID=1894999 RepID=UPI002629756E|nr:ATPase, T2SS/T4P/T4SS family [Enhydrobacter sp.]WIM13235.1 MAG: Type II/IV secretion system ATP hydrolase TadA/VirB11/CpaF, TadA subfamily [Enhydrobacter sp.]
MFGLRSRSTAAVSEARADALDRLGRRAPERRPDSAAAPIDRSARLDAAAATLAEAVGPGLQALVKAGAPAGEITRQAGLQTQSHFHGHGVILAPLELRGFVTDVLRPVLPATNFAAPASPPDTDEAPVEATRPRPVALPEPAASPLPAPSPARPREAPRPEPDDRSMSRLSRSKVEQARRIVQSLVIGRIDLAAAVSLPRKELVRQLEDLVSELLAEHKLQLNRPEQDDLVYQLVNDMLGLGPLEPLLEDEGITDIMVNGPRQIYVEKHGKLELTSVTFEDNAHLLNICNRIVSRIGRRVDESSPICDARLLDGSRVNIIIPPLAIDGASVSIRKFGKRQIGFDQMVQQGNISAAMATLLRIAARSRLNMIVSGGTGSGKTTMLNALSGMIDNGERVVTIEDAAELRMQQPHVVRLETRPANLEGNGEITMRDLVKNALRMRPDRIILGEVRGPEAIDLLQAMNTGHDGSMGTLHANRPREALTRLENMVTMGVSSLPPKAIRTQIAGSLQLIVQISRMRDGIRRVTHITEVMGMEGEVIITQDLFTYEFKGEAADGTLNGAFKSSGLRPHFLPRAAYYGLDKVLMEAIA